MVMSLAAAAQESHDFNRGRCQEEQENDRAARIIRSSYTGDYGEQGKVVLDEANGL